MNLPRFILRGYSDAHVAEAALEDRLIDIAYVERVSPEEIQIVLDPAMPFDDAKDFDWLKSVIEKVLADAGQARITIEAIDPGQQVVDSWI